MGGGAGIRETLYKKLHKAKQNEFYAEGEVAELQDIHSVEGYMLYDFISRTFSK